MQTHGAGAPAAAAAGEQSFEDSFSEFAKARTDSTQDTAAPADKTADAGVDQLAPGAGESKKDDAAAGANGDAAAGTKAADTVDPWKDAPQALREAHERELAEAKTRAEAAETARKSAEGRYKAAQTKLNHLEKGAPPAAAAQPAAAAKEASTATPESGKDAGGTAAGVKTDDASPAVEMPPEWKDLQDNLPDVAAAVEARFKGVFKVVDEARKHTQIIEQDTAERFKTEQSTVLNDAYPGWDKAVRTPEFKDWLGRQPQAVKSLAASDYAADNAALLEYYGYKPSKPEATNDAPAAGGKTAAQIQADRDAALLRGTSVKGSGASGVLADAPNDFEAAFSYYAKKRQDASRRSASP